MKKFANCSDPQSKKEYRVFAFAGAVDVQKASSSLIAAKTPPERRNNGWLSSVEVHFAALLLLLFPFVCVVSGSGAPAVSYALTTTLGPVVPGQTVQFTVTATNLSSVAQAVYLYYNVPKYTTSSGYAAGTAFTYNMGNVAAGATAVVSLDFKVLSGTQAPPDSSVITLLVSDKTRSLSVSCSATVRTVQSVVLELSTPQSPATSGGNFTYTLSYHNGTTSALTNAKLSLPVPAGVGFVSADGGGVLNAGAVVWTLSSVPAGATGEVNVNLKAPTTTVAHEPLLLTATFRNSASQILAQASDAKAMFVTPALAYALTTTAGPAVPGQTIQFTVTVTNLSSVAQAAYIYYDVPQFTSSDGYAAGTTFSHNFGNVAAGATAVVSLDFTVLSGTQAPPDGSLLTAVVTDRADGALVSCSATVRSVPAAVLEIATAQSPATSAGNFTYTLSYHNGTTSALSSAQLSLPVPTGASFVSADGGGAVGADEVVRWTLSSVAAGASGEVNVNLKAPTTSVAHAPLLLAAAFRNSASQILAQASDAKAMFVTPALAYALTTTGGPAVPGQTIQFTVTVTNLSSAAQAAYIYYDVPQFTSSDGYAAGTTFSHNFGNVAAGATAVVSLDFTVLSGTQAPPDGSLLTAVVTDRDNGALVSCSATVRSVPAAVLEIATAQSPATSAGNFTYTLSYHNGTTSALSSAQLSLPVPIGASFVSADGDGLKGNDGVVRWTLSSVPAGSSGQVNVTLKAPTTSVAHAPLLLAAAFRNSAGQILAQASDAKAMFVTPALAYALTTTAGPVVPGQTIQFTVTVTNLSKAAQAAYIYYDVPQFTSSDGYAAGTTFSYNFGNVAAGATEVVSLDFTVLSGTQAPPDGSLLTAVVTDRTNGALVSCSTTVRSVRPAVLEIATAQGPTTSGGNFTYTLSYHNGTTSALSSAQLSLPVPTGASFVSTTGGGVLGNDGVVRWTFSSVPAGASGHVGVTLKAPTTTVAQAPLLLAAAFRNSAGQILAQASDAKAIDVTAVLAYSMTTTANPAHAGQVANFTVSVTNRSSAAKAVYFYYDVPQFTTDSGYAAGTTFSYNMGNVAAGATQKVTLSFTVLSGTQAPPNGSLFTLLVSDRANGAVVSETATVQ